jgi:nitroreductase
MEVLNIIKERRSPFNFKSDPVPPEVLKTVFEAARYAPSSMNEQPWSFMLITRENTQTFEKLLSVLEPGNRIWASSAYALAISLAKRNFTYKSRLNYYAVHDTGMAVSNILAQATSMGVSIHQMGGYDREKLRKEFSIGEEYETVAVMAIGYKGEDADLSAELKERWLKPKQRRELSDFLYGDKLGDPLF